MENVHEESEGIEEELRRFLKRILLVIFYLKEINF